MPSLYNQLLTQAGGRNSGSPIARPTGGGTSMQVSQPSYPSPPSSSAGPTGRPSSRPVTPSAPGVLPFPRTPAAPVPPSPADGGAPGAPSPTAPAPRRMGIPTGEPGGPPAQPQPAPQPQGSLTPAATTTPGGGVVLNLSRVPARRDWVGLPPGAAVQTPYGHANLGDDGHPIITFASPEHEARYRTDEANYARSYGPTPFAGMPGAPQPPVTLGRSAYNPFSGTWLNPQGGQ